MTGAAVRRGPNESGRSPSSGALWHPGMTIHDLLDHSLVAAARVAGMVAALMTIATRLREFAAPS